MTTDQRSRTALVVGGVGLAIVIAVAIVLAMRPPATFDPATPEGTTQGYFQAVLDGDWGRAMGHITADLQAKCADVHHDLYHDIEGTRVVIKQVDIDAGIARVDVEITETHGRDPFGSGSYSFDETLVMERVGDRWLISRLPWPIFHCPEV